MEDAAALATADANVTSCFMVVYRRPVSKANLTASLPIKASALIMS